MLFCFADDSGQDAPSRPGLRAMRAVGGVLLDAASVGPAERAIDGLCRDYGFPAGEEFKWSPGRELWMRDNLIGDERADFLRSVMRTLDQHDASVVVAITEDGSRPANEGRDLETDATILFLERVSNRAAAAGTEVCTIIDRPPGDRGAENAFLKDCIEHLRDDATFAAPERFALPVTSAQSRLVRLLQAADVVTAVTLARVAGEDRYSPPVFEEIKGLLPRELGRVGGVGLKVHPDFRLVNLNHWVAGDNDFVRFWSGQPLPMNGAMYVNGPGDPSQHRVTVLP